MENNGEILIYQTESGDIKLEVSVNDETVWLTQEQMASLFGKARSTINEHIRNIFNEGELVESQVLQKFGNSEFQKKQTNYYNLDVIISIGYRVKSPQGTQFRIWATQRLKDFIIKGFVLNDQRFKTGNSMDYFNELQSRIREIRLSEKFFYQKIKDIYTTSIDYNPQTEKTRTFFKVIQNKLLWAISGQTAAEIVSKRIDASLPLLGMLSFDKEASTRVKKTDISIAKNYLNEDEIKLLGLLIEQFLAFAEAMAQQHTPMYMDDWIKRLDVILQMNGRELLTHAGKISRDIMLETANIEYDKYNQQLKQLEKETSLAELEKDLKALKTP